MKYSYITLSYAVFIIFFKCLWQDKRERKRERERERERVFLWFKLDLSGVKILIMTS
jgi:bacteriorhodopsin